MSKKLVLFLIPVFLLSLIFTGCGSTKNPALGKWKIEKVSDNKTNEAKSGTSKVNDMLVQVVKMVLVEGADVEFLKDGTANTNGSSMKYKWVDDTHLETTPSNGGNSIIFETQFKDNELTLKYQYLTFILKKK